MADVKVHDVMAAGRAFGYPWQDINDELAKVQAYAMAVGHSPLTVARQLGYADPQLLRDRLEAEALIKASGWADQNG